MLRGSAHTRSTFGSTSSIDRSVPSGICCAFGRSCPIRIVANTANDIDSQRGGAAFIIAVSSVDRSALAHAGVFRLLRGGRLVFMLRGPHAPDRVDGAGTKIDVEVIHVASHVWVVAECRHHIVLRGADVLAAAG